ncbi:putative Separase [Melia azedarach]|uniref:Separase n=1 Tax=Melia azedarach TaxID=155640 RepID=A0ACC1Y1F6_MELAZ|nr:putative Separase [Melia azedarach]
MASSDESSLLTKLESSNSSPIYSLFSDYLRPFTDLKTRNQNQTQIRALAKKFLSFLNKSLSILQKRLSSGSHAQDPSLTTQLFDTYELCLNCLDSISSQLSCKPYMIQSQRLRLVSCLEASGKHEEAESQGFRVLEKLRGMDFEGKSSDSEFARVFVEIVAVMVKCAATRERKDGELYRRVLGLVEEASHWFRVLDANAYEKLHRVLVCYLGKCTQYLVGELMCFNGDLVHKFCVATLTEYTKSSMKDQFCKFSRRLCSSLFLLQENNPSLVIGIVLCVLDSVACQCKVGSDNSGIELIELVSYCANKCRAAGTIFCSTVAGHLNHIAGDFPQVMSAVDLMLRLYAAGLCLTNYAVKFRGGDLTSSKGAKDEFAIRILLHDGEQLHNLTSLLGASRSYFSVCCKENFASSASQICLQSDSSHEASITSMEKNKEAYMLPYLNALKFLCQPLAELVNLEKKELVAEIESASVHPHLCIIQDAFEHFSDVFIFFQSCASERVGGGFDDSKTILCVAVAAFILSITTNHSLKKTVNLMKHIIASEWIQPQGLKYLFASLYNIGVLLYRNNQVKEASKALKLCCRASWACVVLLCKMFECKSDGSHGELSEGAIVDFVNEACTRSAFLLDVLHHSGSQKMEKVILESLENWAIAANLFSMLPGLKPLVKQWVKIECRLRKNSDVEDDPPTLYYLLSASEKVSEKTIGIILEEELHAYEELNALGPELCQRMQMKIISILQKSVYSTRDNCLQRSRILLREGRVLRAKGAEGLKACIQCLSEAISIMNGMYDGTSRHATLPHHQLAVTYCLRALCTQEAEPNSKVLMQKQVIEDIGAALNLWLSMSTCSANDECNMLSENTMLLLYNVVDLLSIKGCIEFHQDIYKLMIRLFKWKNVPLEKCLFILWESRRLSHALCVSPVNDAFLINLAEQCGEPSKSVDFWISCLKESQPLLIGFQQSFLFLFANSSHGCYNRTSSVQSGITINDVKEAASELISSVPLPLRSVFLVGYLYYDLCERLIANGRLFEALSYAKEAHRLRTQLFQEKFSYSVEEQVEIYDEAGDNSQKPTYGPKKFKIARSVASEVWSFDASSWNVDDCYLSPWNVLQCYLESTLQVGIIHELVGNGVEAETFLVWGKSISCSQSLPQFIVAFSSVLGKLYRKKQLWDLAEKELKSSKQILISSNLSCLKCKLILDVTVDQQLGDLSRNCSDSAMGSTSIERLSHAEEIYRSALDKLNISEWKNSISLPERASSESTLLKKASVENVEKVVDSTLPQLETMELTSGNRLNEKVDGKKCRKTKNAPKSLLKDLYLVPEPSYRITRSKYRSSQNKCLNGSIEVPRGSSKQTKGNNVSNLSDTPSQEESVSETKSCIVDAGTCICNKMKCWQCLPGEVIESRLLVNFVNIKWEFVRRRLSLRVLTGIGKCFENRNQIHEAHKIILQSVSILLSRDSFCHTYSSFPPMFLLDLIGKEFSGDVFAVERATVLYNICWFSLKGYGPKKIRKSCCELSNIQLQQLVSWLMLAFVLCCEVPILFQKVSRLLAVMYILSSTSKHFSLSSSSKELSESHWASFFHQASLGTHLSYQFLSNMSRRCKAQDLLYPEGLHVPGSSYTRTEMCNSLRVSPESIKDLEQFVKDFFVGLPCTTIICVTLLGGAYANLLQELLPFPSCVHAWMLFSRLNSKIQPIVVLLPVNKILEENEDDANIDFGELYWKKTCGRHWHCPWGSTIVDEVAPGFKLILEDSYLSSSAFPSEDNQRTRSLWWMYRKKLDHCLGELLRKLEDSWLGSWKYMLLGEWSNFKTIDAVHKRLAHDLKSKCKIDVNESLLRVVLGALKDGFKEEECIAQLCSKKGCYIGAVGYYDNDSCSTSSGASNGVEKLSELALQLIHEAVTELEEESVNREPTILVLDCEVQMLPWENIPILRKQEVYRMPSVGSISATLERIHHHQEHVKGLVATFPLIDPLDAFYLLNPSGDLSRTQFEFEDWCKDQNLEGKAGSAPSAEELVAALKSHDLFLYFGHGSGAQYISRHDLLKLEKCAATFLMGCSSGSLSLNGCYIPQGTPLYYLLAGSPVIVANLWDVTDKDIDRFGKAMLDAWLGERSTVSADCNQCTSLVEENEAKNGRGKGNKKKISRKKLPETNDCDIGLNKNGCDHRPKLGSFMPQAREACKLPFLIGASPVCYGVPTGIRRKLSL